MLQVTLQRNFGQLTGERMSLLKSFGLKRYLAAFLSSLLAVIASTPGLAPLLPVVTYIAGALGLTGLLHGAAAKNLGKHKPVNFAALLALLVAVVESTPQLQPWAPLARLLASWFGAAVVGHTLAK